MSPPENEPLRPAVGDQGAERDEIGEQAGETENAVTTTSDGEKILAVEAWIDGSRLAYWCSLCATWHGHGHDTHAVTPTLHRSHCRFVDGQVRITVIGPAPDAVVKAIKINEPPFGPPEGRELDANSFRLILATQARWIIRLLRRRAPATRVMEALQRGEAMVQAWRSMSGGGLYYLRRRRLLDSVRAVWEKTHCGVDAVVTALAAGKLDSSPSDYAGRRSTAREVREHIESCADEVLSATTADHLDYRRVAGRFVEAQLWAEAWCSLRDPGGTRAPARMLGELVGRAHGILWRRMNNVCNA